MKRGLLCYYSLKPRILMLSCGNKSERGREWDKNNRWSFVFPFFAIKKNLSCVFLLSMSAKWNVCAFTLCAKYLNIKMNSSMINGKELKVKLDACSRIFAVHRPISAEAREIYLSCLAETHNREITVKSRKQKTADCNSRLCLACYFLYKRFLHGVVPDDLKLLQSNVNFRKLFTWRK